MDRIGSSRLPDRTLRPPGPGSGPDCPTGEGRSGGLPTGRSALMGGGAVRRAGWRWLTRRRPAAPAGCGMQSRHRNSWRRRRAGTADCRRLPPAATLHPRLTRTGSGCGCPARRSGALRLSGQEARRATVAFRHHDRSAPLPGLLIASLAGRAVGFIGPAVGNPWIGRRWQRAGRPDADVGKPSRHALPGSTGRPARKRAAGGYRDWRDRRHHRKPALGPDGSCSRRIPREARGL